MQIYNVYRYTSSMTKALKCGPQFAPPASIAGYCGKKGPSGYFRFREADNVDNGEYYDEADHRSNAYGLLCAPLFGRKRLYGKDSLLQLRLRLCRRRHRHRPATQVATTMQAATTT